jgi:hypothetical protein
MIISSTESLIGMSKRLESMGISNIHFYNSRTRDLNTPMVALLPFCGLPDTGKRRPWFSASETGSDGSECKTCARAYGGELRVEALLYRYINPSYTKSRRVNVEENTCDGHGLIA